MVIRNRPMSSLPVLPAGHQGTAKASQGNCKCPSADAPKPATSIDARTLARIEKHPCYSEEAHHFYARMHVAVAPACNIQCNFCNRKYDCANESRPGVVSELLTPQEAAHKVLVVAERIPQMTVVGIAGPGDPLANPEHTFETFERIAAQAPDLKLCLSSNGLAVPEHIERIKALNVDHVTLTINMIDPDIGMEIYPWVHFERRRYRGREASELLHQRQMESLDLLRKADILVKVNSVLIPGINDKHLVEVNRTIREKGAFLHNIMPLISAPEHGTVFGLRGQRGPTQAELTAVQDACGEGSVKMMRHCRQCRADAVGLLGEDRSQEFSKEKVLASVPSLDASKRLQERESIELFREQIRKAERLVDSPDGIEDGIGEPILSGDQPGPLLLAVASKGGGLVNQHFGHAKEFQIYAVDAVGSRFVGHRKVDHYCQGGYGEEAAFSGIAEILSDCAAVIVSRIGASPRQKLEKLGLPVIESNNLIKVALREAFGELSKPQAAAEASEGKAEDPVLA
ncbi:nitrogenase cofactor biosynthesis protein NifB [Vulcanococcus limneticus Candia 3F8]|uniref:nitrogenase cofactor biosynthesis protein NifB n=3 Tax=Vulcanococcus limneticus TaxID=2170428 RepID=UPI001E4CA59D|nr:nitrogenase cofactor biosynthesis protein NifB [Vulcanococcus limneticus]MCP9792950.1 nitrogenase cofactor biosynthesis protein NifB [Vulcanococcus limneticus MW73D5]MCP9894855.1 nitrogenase cofactor biosynthesis protein NifB [Vulcanococcus limneticus Candia 3F8]